MPADMGSADVIAPPHSLRYTHLITRGDCNDGWRELLPVTCDLRAIRVLEGAMISEPFSLCETEAHQIYVAIFGREIPSVVLDRFVIASKRLNQSVLQAEMDDYYRAILACSDLEALELAARYTRRFPLLSRKLRLMAYLAETLPENQAYYVNERSSFIGGMARSALGVFRTAYKMVKGLWLVRRAAHA
jgi:hypothetical protein